MVAYGKVVIAGVGLLGGSIGLRLRSANLAAQVIGWGRDAGKLQEAVKQGAIDAWELDLGRACVAADVAVACTPVGHVPAVVQACSANAPPECLITDVGSTKAQIAESLAEVQNFCPCHPLAGGEKSGCEYASAELFQGRTCVLTPPPDCEHEVVQRAEEFWQALGADTLRMTPQQHDVALAKTSHLPHVVASVLSGITPAELLPLAATGWSDTTRVAAGNVELWLQILRENRGPILDAIQLFGSGLRGCERALEQEDYAKLEEILTTGKRIRDSLGN